MNLERIRARLSFANVVSCVALFIALGGTGYAAFKLPRNSVGSRELRTNAVGHAEIADDAVRGDNVRDGSLDLRDLSSRARGALAGDRGPAGSQGPQGPSGANGAVGAPGKDAVSLWAIVDSFGVLFGGNAAESARVGTGDYKVSFARSVAGCAYSATLAVVQASAPAGSITVAEDGTSVRVKTYGITHAAENIGFHLIVVC
jgi:hypothetical protein